MADFSDKLGCWNLPQHHLKPFCITSLLCRINFRSKQKRKNLNLIHVHQLPSAWLMVIDGIRHLVQCLKGVFVCACALPLIGAYNSCPKSLYGYEEATCQLGGLFRVLQCHWLSSDSLIWPLRDRWCEDLSQVWHMTDLSYKWRNSSIPTKSHDYFEWVRNLWVSLK